MRIRRVAHTREQTCAAARLAAAALLLVGFQSAEAGPSALGGEAPLGPRSSGPRSAPGLFDAANETIAPVEQADVLKATGTEDEREGAAPEESPSTLRAFLDEMLDQGRLWAVLPKRMAVETRCAFLEEQAIRTYREGMLRFPNSPRVPAAYMEIASIWARRGDRRAALDEYARLLERFPNHDAADNARLARARLMLEGRDDAGARDESYLLMDTFPESPLVADAYLIAARAHERLGELDEAVLAYTHVLHGTGAKEARYVQAREGMAAIEFRRGHVENAIAIYKELFENAPGQVERDAREFALAAAYLDAGETMRARLLLRRIVVGDELNAHRAEAAFLLADAYAAEGRVAEALQSYVKALRDFPDFEERIPALFRAAEAYAQLGLYDEALAMVRQVPASRNPAPTPRQCAEAALAAAEFLYADRRYDAALEAFYGALVAELTPAEQERAAYRIAQCYYRGGYYNEALEACEAAMARAPEHELAFEAALAAADCYEKKGWLDDARQCYRALLDETSGNDSPAQHAACSTVVFKLLDTYSERGFYQEELDCARALLQRRYPFLDDARLLYRMARAYEHLNNSAQAKALYAQVQTQFPNGPWAEHAAIKIRHMDMLEQITAWAH